MEERQTYTNQSKFVTLRGSLHQALLRQERLLPNKCNIRIMLIPHAKAFYSMSDDDSYKVNVESGQLTKLSIAQNELTKIKMIPAVLDDHSMALLKPNARYSIRKSEIKTFSIPKGNVQTVKESLFSGQLPRRLVIGLLDSQALTGHNKKNPFNFQHFNPNYLCIYVDGERVPTRPLTPDYTNLH